MLLCKDDKSASVKKCYISINTDIVSKFPKFHDKILNISDSRTFFSWLNLQISADQTNMNWRVKFVTLPEREWP